MRRRSGFISFTAGKDARTPVQERLPSGRCVEGVIDLHQLVVLGVEGKLFPRRHSLAEETPTPVIVGPTAGTDVDGVHGLPQVKKPRITLEPLPHAARCHSFRTC